MTLSHNIFVKEAWRLWIEQCALQRVACGVVMLDWAFGDPRECERRLSGSWASQLPLELCGPHLHPVSLSFYLSASFMVTLIKQNTDSKHFYAQALSARELTKLVLISNVQNQAKKSALHVSNAACWEALAAIFLLIIIYMFVIYIILRTNIFICRETGVEMHQAALLAWLKM